MDSRGDRGHPEPGATLGNYRIERLLGRGGMGAVFLAYDSSLQRQVAVKLVAEDGRDEGSRAQLLREARSAAALNHPAICTIHEVGDANGATFIAMEYVEGRSLHDRLADGPLPIELALDYAIQAADALAYAHDRGVVHRDFKAGNVIVTPAGRIKIIDFGLARRLEGASATATTMASISASGSAAGTPYAMAPEQVRAETADARTDIWALGVARGRAAEPELPELTIRRQPDPHIHAWPADEPTRRCVGPCRASRRAGRSTPWSSLSRVQGRKPFVDSRRACLEAAARARDFGVLGFRRSKSSSTHRAVRPREELAGPLTKLAQP